MGYDLTIGELQTDVAYEGLESYVRLEAATVSLDTAPAYGEPTDFMNQRWPSYSSWREATKFIGLYDLMFDKDTGLMSSHPGCRPLVKEHKEIIDEAYKTFYLKYPSAKAGYAPDESEDWPEENEYATRLEWLKFWVDWALVNCNTPVFINT